MAEILNFIIGLLMTIAMFIFLVIVVILNNIDEFVDWINKRNDRKNL